MECVKSTQDLVNLYLHESNRVYRDKMVEEKDLDLFDKIQVDVVKKIFDVSIALWIYAYIWKRMVIMQGSPKWQKSSP